MNTIRDDFDRIAALSGSGWDHNSQYHGYLLRHLFWRYSLIWANV